MRVAMNAACHILWQDQAEARADVSRSGMSMQGDLSNGVPFLVEFSFCACGIILLAWGVSSAFVLLRFLTSEHELSLSASALWLFHLSAFYGCLLLVFAVFLLLLLFFCFSALLLLCLSALLLCLSAALL